MNPSGKSSPMVIDSERSFGLCPGPGAETWLPRASPPSSAATRLGSCEKLRKARLPFPKASTSARLRFEDYGDTFSVFQL